MGLEVAVGIVSAAGIYAFRSLTGVNRIVRQISVPTNSLLAKHTNKQNDTEYKDAYRIQLPRRYKLLRGTGSKNELTVAGVASSFFLSKLFRKLEFPVIRWVCRDKNKYPVYLFHLDSLEPLKYRKFRFDVGDRVMVWTLVGRRREEILMEWSEAGVSGTTWFNLPNDDNCIIFGSSIALPASDSAKHHSDPSVKLFIQASKSLKEDRPISERLKRCLINTVLGILIPFHKLYSKYLLVSTIKKLDQNKLVFSKEESPKN